MAQSHSGPPWTMNWVYKTGPRVHRVFQGISFVKLIRKMFYCVINPIYSLKIIELISGKCNFAFKPSSNIFIYILHPVILQKHPCKFILFTFQSLQLLYNYSLVLFEIKLITNRSLILEK